MTGTTTAQAVAQLESTVLNLLPDAENRVSALEQAQAARLAGINTGFCLTDTLMDFSDTPISLNPRFESLQNAKDFEFSAAEDYAPEGCFVDLYSKTPGQQVWWSEPAPTQFTGRVSIYASIAVGTNPNATPKAESCISVLQSNNSGYHQLISTGSAVPNYTEARLLGGIPEMESFQLKGQSWGIIGNNDLFALAENEPFTLGIGFSFLRLINLGNQPIHIKGLWIVHHAENKS